MSPFQPLADADTAKFKTWMDQVVSALKAMGYSAIVVYLPEPLHKSETAANIYITGPGIVGTLSQYTHMYAATHVTPQQWIDQAFDLWGIRKPAPPPPPPAPVVEQPASFSWFFPNLRKKLFGGGQ